MNRLDEFKGGDLKDVRVGDTLKIERVVKVTGITNGYTYRSVQVRDVKTGRQAAPLLDSGHNGTLKVTRVRKAKPKAGDVITGKELKATMWKRGTTFLVLRYNTVIVLDANGKMQSSRGTSYPIEEVGSAVEFKILHVA